MRTKQVHGKIAKKLEKQGHTRNWKQCRSKVKNLKTSYKEVKDHNNKTGNGRNNANSTKSWTAFLGIDQLPHPSLSWIQQARSLKPP